MSLWTAQNYFDLVTERLSSQAQSALWEVIVSYFVQNVLKAPLEKQEAVQLNCADDTCAPCKCSRCR